MRPLSEPVADPAALRAQFGAAAAPSEGQRAPSPPDTGPEAKPGPPGAGAGPCVRGSHAGRKDGGPPTPSSARGAPGRAVAPGPLVRSRSAGATMVRTAGRCAMPQGDGLRDMA